MKPKFKSFSSRFSKKKAVISPQDKKSILLTVPHACPFDKSYEEAICDKNVDVIANSIYEKLDPDKIILLGAIDRKFMDLNRKESAKKFPEWIEEIKNIFSEEAQIVLDIHSAPRGSFGNDYDIVIFDMPQSPKDNEFAQLLQKRLGNEFGEKKVGIVSKKKYKRDFIIQSLLAVSKDKNSKIALIEFMNDLPPEETARKFVKVMNNLREEEH